MVIRVYTSNGRLSKPATALAAAAVVGIGFLVLTFGLLLLTGVAAIGVGVLAVAMARRALMRGGETHRPRVPEGGALGLDPALEVQPRIGALRGESSGNGPDDVPKGADPTPHQ